MKHLSNKGLSIQDIQDLQLKKKKKRQIIKKEKKGENEKG